MEQFEQNPLPLQEQPQYQEQTLTSTPNLPVPRHWLFKWVAWVIGGLVVLFLVLSVIAYSVQRCSPSLNENCPSNFWEFLLSPDFKNPFSGEVEDEVDDTAGWQTYRNDQYGFEFRYPDNFQVIIDEDRSFEDGTEYIIKLYDFDTKAYIDVGIHEDSFDISYIQDRYAPTGVVSPPAKITAGNNIFYYYGPGGGGVAYPDRYFYNLNGKLLEFIFFDQDNAKTPSAQMKQTENQLLSTFKFIE